MSQKGQAASEHLKDEGFPEGTAVAADSKVLLDVLRSMSLRWMPPFVLASVALINIIRGALHVFSDDGFAPSVGGAVQGADVETLTALLAVLGGQQLTLGLLQGWATFWRQQWIPVLLVVQACLTVGSVLVMLFQPFPRSSGSEWFNLTLLFWVSAGVVFSARRAQGLRFEYRVTKNRVSDQEEGADTL